MPPTRQQLEQLRSRERAENNADKMRTGGSFQHCVKLPDGVQFMKLQVKMYSLDILAQFCGPNNPSADKGVAIPYCIYWRHGNLGPDNKQSYPCPAHYKEPERCPFCEYIHRNPMGYDQKTLDGMKAKERMLWTLIDRDDRDKGVQVLDNAPYNGLGDAMKKLKRHMKGDQIYYDDPTNGYTVMVDVEEKSLPQGSMKVFGYAQLEKREKNYKEDIFDKIPVLDQCLLQPSYEELKKVLELSMGSGGSSGGAEDDPDDTPRGRSTSRGVSLEEDDPAERKFPSRPVRDDHLNGAGKEYDEGGFEKKPSGKSRREEPEEDGDGGDEIRLGDWVQHRRYGKCEVVKVRDGLLRLEDSEGDTHPDVRPAEVVLLKPGKAARPSDDDDDDDGDDDKGKGKPPPARKRAAAKSKAVEEEDDEDDPDDGEDAEEEELPRKKTRKK